MPPRYPIGVAFDYGSFRMPERIDDPTGPRVFDPHLWESFLDNVARAFRAGRTTTQRDSWMGGVHTWRLARTHRYSVCIDVTRDPAWVFVQPEARELKSGALRMYRVRRDADRALRRLRKSCRYVTFID